MKECRSSLSLKSYSSLLKGKSENSLKILHSFVPNLNIIIIESPEINPVYQTNFTSEGKIQLGRHNFAANWFCLDVSLKLRNLECSVSRSQSR